MERFINPRQSTSQNSTLNDFSDISHPITSNVIRGYSSNKYSWYADLLFKHKNNTEINKHTTYLSFFSDREIVHQEFGSIERIYTEYPFFSYYGKSIFPEHYVELSDYQYSKVGQRNAEYDIVEYINQSDQWMWTEAEEAIEFPEIDGNSGFLKKMICHNNGKAPIYPAFGYKIDLGVGATTYKGYDKYFWVNNGYDSANTSEVDVREYTNSKIENDYATLFFDDFLMDFDPNNSSIDELTIYRDYEISHVYQGRYRPTLQRIVDYKLHIDNPMFFNFIGGSDEWIIYYNDSMHYYGDKYSPYLGHLLLYDKTWRETRLFNPNGNQSIVFFPEVIQDGTLEPAKIGINWGQEEIERNAVFNPANHFNEPDDQSRIVYNTCRHMFELDSDKSEFIVKKTIGNYVMYQGIDIDTERNRRYSSVVMTEPYFTTWPICGGSIVEYMFVDYSGSPVNFHNSGYEYSYHPSIFLKIKAPISYIHEIDRLLSLEEFNTDIINTLTINDPVHSYYLTETYPYDNFGYYYENFFSRQDMCLDDLVGGIVGTGVHREYKIPVTSMNTQQYYLYSNGDAKVCGAGFVSRTKLNIDGSISEDQDQFLNLYCTNYVANNSYDPTYYIPLPNVFYNFLNDPSVISKSVRYELFRPMIKLPGINGYIKILEKNPHYEITRATDGKCEIIYNVEFPYCPGSYTERYMMNFESGYKRTQVLYKKNYINAGAWEVFTS